MKRIKQVFCVVLSLLFVMQVSFQVQASDVVPQRTVKVGFFSADGYHIMDEDGIMSGYGFDFLQMMLRYNNWSYEYVGYDANWGDMIDMLETGDIDMVTLANQTPERMEKFAFSEKSIGTSSTIMTTSANNTKIIPGEYDTYDGAVVGLVSGSSHNEKFEEYASQLGFTYTIKYYQDIDELLADLRAGQNIDIAVTSNMRQVEDEVILNEFNATEYYVMVRKDDTELLKEINTAISQLNIYSPNWRTSLFQKYYENINEKVILLSLEERDYLEQFNANKEVLKVAMNPELAPYSYFEKGEAKGIAPVLFAEIANRLGIAYEILESKDRWEYKDQLNSGEADIDLTAYLDYSIAQKYNLKETDAYITSTMAMLSKKNNQLDNDNMTVAVVRDPTEYIDYNNQLIYRYHYKEYESIQDCIDAVKNGEVDATFRYVYIAEHAVVEDYTNQLQYSILPDYTFGLALGVNNALDHRLLSLLNKSVNSLNSSYVQSVMLEQSTQTSVNTSILAVAYDHPWFMAIVIVMIFLGVFALVLLLLKNKEQKNKILTSLERERFIGYICEIYELVVEINLQENTRNVFRLVDHKLVEDCEPNTSLDLSYFSTKVIKEDLDKVVKAFSLEQIDQMIAEGGTQQYVECRRKDEEGKYQWYSYLIKAIPKDEKHPRNFITFMKNIQKTKETEEEQKQILRDALESAQNANVAKGQFLSRMSHEIRTPLNAVIGYMQIAKDSVDNTSKMLHCVENSDMAAKHLLSIINDVLDISSIESGKMKIAHEAFDLKEQITSISTIFFQQAKNKKVKFEVIVDNITQEWVIGDKLRVNQILMNLLSNAIKFTPEEGHVNLSVNQVKVDNKRVFMKYMVSDSGIGMSEEYQQRLFQPFEQESAVTAQKYGGTGLGLSITQNLVQMMGGSIEVISKQNEGTTFVVSLHFDQDFTRIEDRQNKHDYSKIRVLLVTDDESSCGTIKALLKRCKVKCDVAENEEKAIKQMMRRFGTNYAYNMCLLDCDMQALNCDNFIEQVKKLYEVQMPLMIAIAYDIAAVEDRAQNAEISQLIAKPLFQSTMFDLLVSSYGKYDVIKPESQNMESLKGLHVLLAEDNPMNQEIAIEILKKAGLSVEAVSDGQQAYEVFTNAKEGTYDAILMDIQMPVMDGHQATGAIRRSSHPEAKTIPIIAMTANAFAEDVNAALASGMNGHIAKPVDYEKLYAVLNKFCHKE